MAFDGDYARATVTELVGALRDRAVSARELCDQAIARIEADDGKINAVVVRDFERARDAAKHADEAIARGEHAPLLGVPMTVKESFDVAGLPTSWGLAEFKDFRPARDAVAIERLKRAGAVILGKTNVAPALSDYQSDNPVYGRTNHPRNAARTPGGSSGGSAAALAAGYVPLELGSDIAGSIRVPSSFCGVFGHKPTHGILPMRGHNYPGTDGAEPALAVIGPLARSTADLSRALDVLAGPTHPESAALKLSLPPARQTSLRDLRVLLLEQHPGVTTATAVRGAVDALGSDLAKAGARVARESALLPNLEKNWAVYFPLLLTIVGAPVMPDGSTLSALKLIELLHAQAVIQRRWDRLFEEFDVVVAPSIGTVATEHAPFKIGRSIVIDGAETALSDQFAWSAIATLPGLPATAVPIGTSPEGLPIGAQIIGPRFEDRTPLAVSEAIERELRPVGTR
ncbi:MAG: amidase family protein [Polyangiales bacterium]